MRAPTPLGWLMLVGAALVVARVVAGCGPARLTPAEGADLLDHADVVKGCQDQGRAARDAAAYDACVADAGGGK